MATPPKKPNWIIATEPRLLGHLASQHNPPCGFRVSTPTPQPSEPRGTLPWPQYGPNEAPPCLVITPVRLDPKGSPGTTRAEAMALVTHPTHSKQQIQAEPQGTTPEELATIVAEELAMLDLEALAAERELGEATRDQWDPLTPRGQRPTDEERKAEHERWLPLHRRLAQGPDD